MLQRMRELATQGNNDSLDDTQRGYIATEIDALRSEINQVVERTTFNGKTLLDGSVSGLNLAQVGTAASANYARLVEETEYLLHRQRFVCSKPHSPAPPLYTQAWVTLQFFPASHSLALALARSHSQSHSVSITPASYNPGKRAATPYPVMVYVPPALVGNEYTPGDTPVTATAAPLASTTRGAAAPAHGEANTTSPPTSDASATGATRPAPSTDAVTRKAP